MPCLCVATVCQAMSRIREISCTWMRKQGLPLGHWLEHKHPFNRLTPHFAPKAGWRVPGGGERDGAYGWRGGGGQLLFTSWKPAAEENRHLISQPFPSRRGPSRTMQRFPFQRQQGLYVGAVAGNVSRKNTLCSFKESDLRWPDQTLYLSEKLSIW